MFVLTDGPKYNYTLVSQAHGPQYIDELLKIIQIYNLIENNLRKNLIFRLNLKNFGWNIKDKIEKTDPKIRFDKEINFYKSISNKKLLIFNYNGTSFLEALSLNIPSIIILDENIWQIRESEQKYFNLLKEVKILYTNQKDISNFINKSFNDIDKWWNCRALQHNIRTFCTRFIKYDEKLLNKIISK